MPTQLQTRADRLPRWRFRAPLILLLAALAWLPIAALVVAWLGL